MALQEHGTWAGELGIQTWPRESILDICPVWVSWFDRSARTSNPLRVGRYETKSIRADKIHGYCSFGTVAEFSTGP
jgi:hypothetical protein